MPCQQQMRSCFADVVGWTCHGLGVPMLSCVKTYVIYSARKEIYRNPKQRQYPGFERDPPFLAVTCAERNCRCFGTICAFPPLLQGDVVVGWGSMFRYSAVPIGIQLINNLWRTRKSRLWDLRTFPFTMRSHFQVFGKFLLDISESAFLYN